MGYHCLSLIWENVKMLNNKMIVPARIITALLLASLLLAACNLPSTSRGSKLTPSSTTSSAEGTATPYGPTDDLSDLGGTPIPGVPTPVMPDQAMPAGQVNWLVLGSDFRPQAGYRTDVIMLVSMNPNKGTVSVVSFPRDLYINIPGWTMQRINTAMAHGGFKMLQDTFETNLGIRPEHYVMTNFGNFKSIVDSLGGADVQVEKNFSDHCDLPQAVQTYCNVTPGTVHMDGATALWYVRARYSTTDFDRERRAQEVIRAIFAKAISLKGLERLPELFSQYQKSVETDLTLTDLLPLLPLGQKVAADPGLVKGYRVIPPAVHGYITPGGADVQIPDFAAIQQILDQAIYNQN
jgi:polyisoprenyl-teichoic acid--peptidoglycan teichoic acid transferase